MEKPKNHIVDETIRKSSKIAKHCDDSRTRLYK